MSRADGTALTGAEALPAAMAGLGLNRAPPPGRGNTGIAADILELAFRMESGRALPVLSRFEGPVTIRLAGEVPAGAARDLGRLVARLRAEAGIDIRPVAAAPAAITVEFVPRRRIRATYANVACFVVPRVSGWEEFRAARGTAALDWTTLARRERAAVFIPAEAAPQEVRDCLHEELAQALGPLNDLYRLPDSVFNDDNFHSALTGFDMVVLRALYDPALAAGMTEAEVAARLPAILARINPRGGAAAVPAPAPGPGSRDWANAVEVALGGSADLPVRETMARRAVALAEAAGWRDARAGLGWFALGRLVLTRDAGAARAAFERAAAIYGGLPGGEVAGAHVAMQLCALDLLEGNPAAVLARSAAVLPAVVRAENAALAAMLMMMRAEALDRLGRATEAQAARLDSRGWGRYGFGAEDQFRARMAEIAALARRG